MAEDHILELKIIDLPGAVNGMCSCVQISSLPGYAELLQKKVEELQSALDAAYPGRVCVRYMDLRQIPEEKETPTGRLLLEGKYPPPLVVIEGEVKYAGSIQIKRIVKDVGEILNS